MVGWLRFGRLIEIAPAVLKGHVGYRNSYSGLIFRAGSRDRKVSDPWIRTWNGTSNSPGLSSHVTFAEARFWPTSALPTIHQLACFVPSIQVKRFNFPISASPGSLVAFSASSERWKPEQAAVRRLKIDVVVKRRSGVGARFNTQSMTRLRKRVAATPRTFS